MDVHITQEQLLQLLNNFEIRLRYQDAVIQALVNVITDNGIEEVAGFTARATRIFNELMKERNEEISNVEVDGESDDDVEIKTPLYYGPKGSA